MTMMNSVCKTVFTVLNGSTTKKYCGLAMKYTSLQGVNTNVPLPHMRTSCPYDKMGSGVLVSTLVEHKVTGVVTW